MNLAPRVGFAWTPHFDDGLLGTIFGKGDETVIRGGWDITYFDEGTNMFASTAGNNTGQSQALRADAGNAVRAGSLTLQSPLPPFQASPVAYQETWNQSEIAFVNGLGSMFSDLETRLREGVEHRRAAPDREEHGHRGALPRQPRRQAWHSFSLNEVNIFENGFLDEFKNAQANLAINDANGRTGFANQGRPGQVALPIFDAAFGAAWIASGAPGNQAYTNATSSPTCATAKRAGSPDVWRPTRRTSAAWSAARSSPCVTRRPQLHRAGPVSDELLPGESVRGQRPHRRGRRRLERLPRDAAPVAPPLRELADGERELHAARRTTATCSRTTRRRAATASRCATSP